MLVFISHSSRDEELASHFIELLIGTLEIRENQIRCTSVPGHKLPPGAHASETLRQEVKDARSFVGLLTKDSLASSYVLFEIGARWGMDGSTVPLLGPEITHKDVPSVLAERHIPKLFDKGDLIQVVEQISKECEVGQKSQIYSNKAIDRFLASLEELAKKKILPLTT